MKKFDVSDLDLQCKIETLSGGELVKLNIISALLKDTPYIIMDEPTNNLDNPSVRMFVEIIEELAQDHTFLIVSHDPRLNFKQYSVVAIVNNSLEIVKQHNGEKNIKSTISYNYPKKKLMLEYMRSSYFIVASISIIIMLIMCIFVNFIMHTILMDEENISDIQDIIVTYKIDMQYDELNKNYVKYEKINVDETKQYKMIYFDDLDAIHNRSDVERIILPNTEYIDKITDEINKRKETEVIPETPPIFSVPKEVLMNFGDQLLLPCDVRMIKKGRLPNDEANEVVISEELLKTLYHIDADDGIGKKILIGDKEYEVVGIGYFDLCLLSFEENSDFGYFVYEENTSKNKISMLQTYLKKEDYYIENGVFNTIIYTKKNCEKTVLNDLITKYPAENYVSKEFKKSHKAYINRNGAMILYFVNILMALVFSLIILSMIKKAIQYQKNKAKSYDNYFCMKNRTIRIFICSSYRYIISCHIITFLVTAVMFSYLVPYLILYNLLSLMIYTIWMKKVS